MSLLSVFVSLVELVSSGLERLFLFLETGMSARHEALCLHCELTINILHLNAINTSCYIKKLWSCRFEPYVLDFEFRVIIKFSV